MPGVMIFFKCMVSTVGTFVMVDESTRRNLRYDAGRVLLNTSNLEIINRVLKVKINEVIYHVRMVEEPFSESFSSFNSDWERRVVEESSVGSEEEGYESCFDSVDEVPATVLSRSLPRANTEPGLQEDGGSKFENIVRLEEVAGDCDVQQVHGNGNSYTSSYCVGEEAPENFPLQEAAFNARNGGHLVSSTSEVGFEIDAFCGVGLDSQGPCGEINFGPSGEATVSANSNAGASVKELGEVGPHLENMVELGVAVAEKNKKKFTMNKKGAVGLARVTHLQARGVSPEAMSLGGSVVAASKKCVLKKAKSISKLWPVMVNPGAKLGVPTRSKTKKSTVLVKDKGKEVKRCGRKKGEEMQNQEQRNVLVGEGSDEIQNHTLDNQQKPVAESSMAESNVQVSTSLLIASLKIEIYKFLNLIWRWKPLLFGRWGKTRVW